VLSQCWLNTVCWTCATKPGRIRSILEFGFYRRLEKRRLRPVLPRGVVLKKIGVGTAFPHQIKRKTAPNSSNKVSTRQFAYKHIHTGSSCFTADFWLAVQNVTLPVASAKRCGNPWERRSHTTTPRAGLKGRGVGAIFLGGSLWRISWRHLCKIYVFAD